jgi:hypothetical protein
VGGGNGVSLRVLRQAWRSLRRGLYVTTHPSVRGDEHCGQAGRARRLRWWDRQISGDAAKLDRRVAEVRVVDPHHPLYGSSFPVSDREARNAALIVVRLPDGRERSITRSATDLAPKPDGLPSGPSRDSHISVRTLLPLANHVCAMLASRNGDLEGGRPPTRAPATPKPGGTGRSVGGPAPPVVRAAAREAAPAGAARGPSAATPTVRVASAKGKTLC